MKYFFAVCCLLLKNISLYSQTEVKLYPEKDAREINIYADNKLLCPVSIKLKLDLMNMECTPPCPEIAVIPENSTKYKVATLSVVNPREANKFGFSYQWRLGNISKKTFDENFVYFLPFEQGKEYSLIQGYKGSFSHQNQNALDFSMPEGSGITAAREGIVVKVIDNNTTSCGEERCKEFNNYLTIYHSDGTFAEYTHINTRGALVTVGDKVKAGQLIARSGNIGWSSRPHLHFMVYMPTENSINTIETKFKIDTSSMLLVPGQKYTRNYD
jgi:murein DD-endopeptidase MepM/ murein hydrolase activator NlpD